MHSTNDRIDRIAHSAQLNLEAGLAAGVPVQLVTCTGPRHGELVETEPCQSEWRTAVDAFLEAATAQPTT
jgi:hypothetical protein